MCVARANFSEPPCVQPQDGVVLGVYESKDGSGFELTDNVRELDQKSEGKLCRHISEYVVFILHNTITQLLTTNVFA